jgi:hypothetical protein
MPTRSILIAILAVACLNGCAAYTVASVGSYVVTQKSLGDHMGTFATGGNCNTIKHLWSGEYICEMPVVYNQNSF